MWYTSDHTVYHNRYLSHPDRKGLPLKNIFAYKPDVWLLGGKLWAAPKNRRKRKLGLLKNQNITNTEQIRKMVLILLERLPPLPPTAEAHITISILYKSDTFRKTWFSWGVRTQMWGILVLFSVSGKKKKKKRSAIFLFWQTNVAPCVWFLLIARFKGECCN